MPKWSFVTAHAAVLTYIHEHGQITEREIASGLLITERTVYRVISDLRADGFLKATRNGRVNHYLVNLDAPIGLGRLGQRQLPVGQLLDLLRALVRQPEKQALDSAL